MSTYDELALRAMLYPNKKERAAKLAELLTHSQGRHTCPDCGNEGPHHVQDDEFACVGCGMQHPVPEIEV